MMECHQNHWKSEFFAEKRLVFENPEKPRPSAQKISKNIDKLLTDLHAQVERNRKGRQKPKKTQREHPTPVHTRREDTRELYRPPEHYQKSVDIAKEILKLKGKMRPFEVRLMQAVHRNLHEQYLNPAFMHYLEQIKKTKVVYSALNQVIAHPGDFEYRSLGNNMVQILKRERNNEKDRNFVITLKTAEGRIAGVNDGTTDVRLETAGNIDWMTNEEYNRQMANYRARFKSEYQQSGHWGEYRRLMALARNGTLDTEGRKKLMRLRLEPYKKISGPMQKIYEVENIQFPKRLIDLIKARGFKFEKGDSRFKHLQFCMQRQGKDYTEITQKKYGLGSKLWVMAIPHPEVRGAYQLFMKPRNPEAPFLDPHEDILSISKEGYFLVQDENGKWQTDPRYKDYLWLDYYRKNKDARVALTKQQKQALKGTPAQIKKAAEAIDTAEQQRNKIIKVGRALQEANLAELKKAAKAITEKEFWKNIEREKDAKSMREKFQKVLEDPDKLKKIADSLGVSFNDTAEEAKVP